MAGETTRAEATTLLEQRLAAAGDDVLVFRFSRSRALLAAVGGLAFLAGSLVILADGEVLAGLAGIAVAALFLYFGVIPLLEAGRPVALFDREGLVSRRPPRTLRWDELSLVAVSRGHPDRMQAVEFWTAGGPVMDFALNQVRQEPEEVARRLAALGAPGVTLDGERVRGS